MKQNLSCPAKTAVAYARYSSAGQRDVSIEQQLADIRAYAAREGYTIIHEFADHARSGFSHTDKRTAFQNMLSAAESGTFDTVLVWKVDRFGRNREDSAVYKGRLRRRGVKVIYVMEPIPDGSAGILLEGMLEATAEWYSVALSENVKRGMDDNASRCIYNGARVLGYECGPDRHYQIVPESAALVRQIYSMCIAGNSVSAIARALNDSGLRNPYGKLWTHTFIYRVLTCEKYTGIYIWKDLRVPGGMPAILDRKTWEDAQAMLQRNIRNKATSNPVPFLLTGKAFCGYCKKPLIGDAGTSKTGKVHHYYACQGKKRRSGCQKKAIRKEQLEDTVINFVFDHCLTGEEMENIAAAVMAAQQKSMEKSPVLAMEKELSEVNRKISNINNAIAEGIWNSTTKVMLDDLTAIAKRLSDSIDDVRRTSGRLADHDSVIAFLKKLASRDRSDPKERQHIINTFVNCVYVFDDHLLLVLNAIEGNLQIPFSPGSDNDSSAPPFGIHPNSATVMYTVAI